MDQNKCLRFFDGYRLLAQVENAEVVYVEKWHTYGQFEIRLPAMEPYIRLDNRIMFDMDEHKTGIIKYIHVDNDGEVTIKGYSLFWMLTGRVTVPEAGKVNPVYDAPVEDIMVDLVLKNAVACTNSKRNFSGLTVQTSQGRGGKIHYETRYDNLADVLTELSNISNLGVSIRMDLEGGKDVFEVREGTDRSLEQETNPPVVFKKSYGNIVSSEYTLNDSKSKNCAYTIGTNEDKKEMIYIVGNEYSGINRKEISVDAKSLKENETLSDKGVEKLSGQEKEENFEFEVTADWYKKRWNLGDKVTIEDEAAGILFTHCIAEIEENYDSSGYTLIPTLGIPESSILKSTFSGSSSSFSVTENQVIIQSAQPDGQVSGRVWVKTY